MMKRWFPLLLACVLLGVAGADCVSTTLACPVFAEGRYNTPAEAARAIAAGAFAVVVGSAITRPQLITRWFAEALRAPGDLPPSRN